MMENGVLVLTGPPCSGKSSVGRLLSADRSQRRRTYIEIDSLSWLLVRDSDRNRRDRMLAYDAAHAVARVLLERGQTVVLECTYSRLEQRLSLARALSDIPGAPVWIVELFVSPQEAVARFRRRDQATDLNEQLLSERVDAFPYFHQALRLASSKAEPQDLSTEIETWLEDQPASIQTDAWVQAGREWD
jgi:predicted kinase